MGKMNESDNRVSLFFNTYKIFYFSLYTKQYFKKRVRKLDCETSEA